VNIIESFSVIISVSERGEQLPEVLQRYHESLIKLDQNFEIIVVLTPDFEPLAKTLVEMNKTMKCLEIVLLNRNYGEAGLLKIGVDNAKYDYVLTLPPYEQISPEAIGEIVSSMREYDAVVVNRSPRLDHRVNRFQSLIFKTVLKMLAYNIPKDPGCGIWFSKKEVFDEVKLYGDLHRFFFMLASQLGFNLLQLDIPQSQADAHRRIYSLRTYLSRLLDIVTVGFLTRFHQKPLRFFGTGGALSAFLGFVGLTYIGIERLFFGVAMGDRPLLVFFCLLLVLGIQLIAIGLVGETIIFTNAKSSKQYRIRKIIN
jgi:glycosyltransferase involved in cell wall biosynthesis